ncbi:aminotransferase class IV [Calditerricola satsumensis]|uniref:aminotransferase class IV n=2 Tax=Calditerricola satsumensis TaxID=373054 RepID=UPI001E2846B7|nr:aminotransferase class IV [Calditerricola satsumensis]
MRKTVIVWVDGALKPVDAVRISPLDHGFLYGAAFFETLRTYGGRPFLLADHLARLRRGLEAAGIRWRLEEKAIARAVAEVLEANGLADGVVRLTVTAGEGPPVLTAAPYAKPMTLLFARPLPPALAAWQERGRPLVTVALPRNGPEGRERYKAHSFLNNLLARRELGDRDAEGLMRTADGRVAEGIVSNVFFVRGDELVTPALTAGILPGVTRRLVLALAPQAGLTPVERDVWPEELAEADEVFLTNAVQELVPVCAVDGRPVRACPGPRTRRLLARYRELAHQGLRSVADIR